MAVKYKEYKPGEYTESDAVLNAQKQADYWGGQKLEDFKYDDFAQSDRTNQYQSQLDNLKGPGDFTFAHQQGWDDVFNKIMNREPFTYDVNGDALYQQYKDQFITGGKMAMMDTMGQAATMTGGYGNSFAQSVGQQAYQSHVQQLTDKIPELYGMALDKYNSEGDELRNQYALYSDQYDKAYGQHRDSVADYNTDRSYLSNMVAQSHGMDMDTYNANRANALAMLESRNQNITSNRSYYTDVYNTLRNTEWGQHMDNETLKKLAIEVANDNLYKQEQNRIADEELLIRQAENTRQQEKWDLEKSSYSTGGSGGGNGNGGDGNGNGGGNDPEPFTGKTYQQAFDYIKKNGSKDADGKKHAEGLRTQQEFLREKRLSGAVTIGEGVGAKQYTNYQEYLKDYVEWATT
jgi:hypothetical protein